MLQSSLGVSGARFPRLEFARSALTSERDLFYQPKARVEVFENQAFEDKFQVGPASYIHDPLLWDAVPRHGRARRLIGLAYRVVAAGQRICMDEVVAPRSKGPYTVSGMAMRALRSDDYASFKAFVFQGLSV